MSSASIGTEVGDQLADFSAELIDGSKLHLTDHRGKVVIINMWATYCGPCVQELPFFQENRFMKVSIEGAPVAGILPVLDTTTQWIADWPATVQKALLGEITAEECMKTLQAAMWEE